MASYADLLAQILDAMRAAGCPPYDPSVVSFGPAAGSQKLHRYRVDGDKAGSKNGWFVFYEDGIPAGAFGSWKLGISETWCAKRDSELSPAERARRDQHLAAARLAREREHVAVQITARQKATALWEKARDTVAASHPYLIKKQIPALGIRQLENALMIPVLDQRNILRSLQFIGSDGNKRFLTGGAVQGNFCPLGTWEPVPATILICEGYATGVSLARASGLPVAVAFHAGNLEPVGIGFRARYPHAALVFCADDDRWNEDPRVQHTGVRYAQAAAAAVDGAFVLPLWDGVPLDSKPTDFNDLQQLAGMDQVKAQLQNALAGVRSPHWLRMDFEQKIESTDDFETLAYVLAKQVQDESVPFPTQSHLLKLISKKIGVRLEDLRKGNAVAKQRPGWESRLKFGDGGALLATLANIGLVLNHHADWRGVLFYDQFSGDVLKRRLPPVPNPSLGEWQDLDSSKARAWLEESYDWSGALPTGLVDEAVQTTADQHSIHVIQEYLEALRWDCEHRLKTWLIRYLGAVDVQDDEVAGKTHRFVGMAWMVGAVKRAFEPGSKFDNVLVLEGPQGAMKSTALAVLGGAWHAESITDVGSKDSLTNLRGKWIIEFAELDALSRVESARIKQHISATHDNYRPPYGRRNITIPRQNAFAATSNPDQYLKDETGARRFWPVRCGTIDIEALRADRDQLWAEAVHCYRSGEQTWADEAMRYIADAQEQRYITDPWEEPLIEFAAGHRELKISDALASLHIEVARQTQADKNRVAKILVRLGFRCKVMKKKKFLSGSHDETPITIRMYCRDERGRP